MNSSSQDTESIRIQNELHAEYITAGVIAKAKLQVQYTGLQREKDARILAKELIDYIRGLVANGMTPSFFNSLYTHK